MREAGLEDAVIEYFEELGYTYIKPEKMSPKVDDSYRESHQEVVLKDYLQDALLELNPEAPQKVLDTALKKILNPESPDYVVNNRHFQKIITDGLDIEYRTEDGRLDTEKIWFFDHQTPENNSWIVTRQFSITEHKTKRLDVVVFINGLPVAVFELKDITNKKATIQKAFTQLGNYKQAIPSFFNYNEVMVISDGQKARAGTITSNYERFMPWRTIDGQEIADRGIPEIYVLINGLFAKNRFLDILRHYIYYQNDEGKLSKILAAYHQYHAVRKAFTRTQLAVANQADNRIGVVWHTQGSGKSISMVFYSGELVLKMDNPTIVVITDRNDLDDQLFTTFAKSKDILRQEPQQADSRENLKELLTVDSGGIVFTTIQKFEANDTDPVLTDRENVIVIADEAHRSQYGFEASVRKNGQEAKTVFGYAKYMRDALPNASFVGFTGTPIEKKDKNTPAIFGDYIDVYDMSSSIKDDMTVPIYYESRIINLELPEDKKQEIDEAVKEMSPEFRNRNIEKYKSKYARLKEVVGAKNRVKKVASEIVDHFTERQEAIDGKAMVVAVSRKVAVNIYNQITTLKPDWHSDDDRAGKIKVVMSGGSDDPANWQNHIRTKSERKKIEKRFKALDNNLLMVIVCDMWLTGFDIPCLHTMYIDKPMDGHTLMQAIARVNRVYKDKPGGLIVDLVGIADSLKKALSDYTESDRNKTGIDTDKALKELVKHFEILRDMLHGTDYERFFDANNRQKLEIITATVEFLLEKSREQDNNIEKRFIKHTLKMQRMFAICGTMGKAQKLNQHLGFFKAVKSVLQKSIETDQEKKDKELEGAINQMVSRSIVTDGVVNIFANADINTPELSILSDEFLEELRQYKHKNIAQKTLERLLKVRIREYSKKNYVKSRKFSEMLEKTLRKYHNRQVKTREVIEELIKLSKIMQEQEQEDENSDLSQEEIAFYDALAQNDSAKEVMGDEVLQQIAVELKEKIINNITIDWRHRESVRAQMRVNVRRLLRKYKYPPDKQKEAVKIVMKQTELMCENVVE